MKSSNSFTNVTKVANLYDKLVSQKALMLKSMLKEYSNVFEGLGKFLVQPYQLRLKPDSVLVKHRQRKVSVHLEEGFHEEVTRLVKIDVFAGCAVPNLKLLIFYLFYFNFSLRTKNKLGCQFF